MKRVKRQLPWIREQIFSNGSYKLISFLVTLVLWMSFVGRKDSMSRDIDVQYLIEANHVITNSVVPQVRVKVEGPKISLTRFSQKEAVFKVDLVGRKLGWNRIKLDAKGLELPVGVKFVAVTPSLIRANIQEISTGQ